MPLTSRSSSPEPQPTFAVAATGGGAVLAEADPPLFFTAARWRTFDALVAGIELGVGLSLLIGEEGAGKSALLGKLRARIAPHMPTVLLDRPAQTLYGLCGDIVRALGLRPEPGEEDRALGIWLGHRARTSLPAALLIDDGDAMTDEVLEHLVVLNEFVARDGRGDLQAGKPVLQIVVAGNEDLRARLEDRRFCGTAAACAAMHVLDPLTAEEVGSFLRLRLRQVRPYARDLVDRRAVRLVVAATGGLPGPLRLICTELARIPVDDPERPISVGDVEAVIAEVPSLEARQAANGVLDAASTA